MDIKKINSCFYVTALLLSACAEKEGILPGERLDSRTSPIVETINKNVALNLPQARVNSAWTQRGGSSSHTIHHPALSTTPALLWRADIGQGESAKNRISAQPVISNGQIFTVDTAGLLSAFDYKGALRWQRQINFNDQDTDIAGGGLAVNGEHLALTTGSGYAALLDARDGSVKWHHKLSAAASAAPALSANRMIVVTGNNDAFALDLKDGRVRWQQSSVGSTASVLGTGSPAIRGSFAIVPYNSGEIQGITIQNGLQAWSQILSGGRIGDAKNIFRALSGDPVIVGNRVYVGSFSGRMAAFDRRSGLRIWTTREGAVGPIVAAGNSLFTLSDQGMLKRLSSSDGSQIWQTALPRFERQRSNRGKIGHFGPLLAGGQLWIASSDKMLRAFNPQSGEQTQSIPLPSGGASAPIVADGHLFVITKNGELHAFK